MSPDNTPLKTFVKYISERSKTIHKNCDSGGGYGYRWNKIDYELIIIEAE